MNIATPFGKMLDTFKPSSEMDVFSISSIPGFPEAEWSAQRVDYEILNGWYEGLPLNDTTTATNGEQVARYPVKLNPIRGAVFKHTAALLGEVGDAKIPVYAKVQFPDRRHKDSARRAEVFLDSVWRFNNGRSMQVRNALLSQIFGGCIFGASYVPDAKDNPFKLKIRAVHPSNFIGTLRAGDETRLSECWIVTPISAHEADKVYGVSGLAKDEPHFYIEYWNRFEYKLMIDGRPIPMVLNGRKLSTWGGPNPYGFVPYVYIPRLRTSSMRGESLISENVRNIVLEINRRVADVGDAVSEDSHSITGIIDAHGTPEMVEVAPGVNVLMIKSSPNISGAHQNAKIESVTKASASTTMTALTDELYKHFRREASIPAIADGEDEGSQRSALTLAMRMWPLLSHTRLQRMNWGDALSTFNTMLLQMGKHAGVVDVPEDFIRETTLESRFYPPLPRDREVFIQELVARSGSNLGSIETLLGLLDDIDDPEEEKNKIIQWLKDVAETQATLNNFAPGAPGNNQSKPQPGNSVKEDVKKSTSDDE